MSPSPDHTETFRQIMKQLNILNNAKTLDWKQIASLVLQLVQLLFSAHV